MQIPFLQNIQVGVDIATSLTIFGAAFSWYLTNKRTQAKERQRGINDAARAVATESIHDVLVGLSGKFGHIVNDAQSIESPIDFHARRNGLESLAQACDDGRYKLADTRLKLKGFREQVSEFYESVATARYLLFPALYYLPEGQDATTILKQGFTRIMQAHNRINGGYVALLAEYQALVEAAEKLKSEMGTQEREESAHMLYMKDYSHLVNSVLMDEDYYDVLQVVIPTEHEALYQKMYGKFSSGADLTKVEKELYGRVCMQLVDLILERPNTLAAVILMRISKLMQETRIECKRFMVSLSAISCRMLAKDNSLPIPALVDELNGAAYFNTEQEIR